MSVNTPDSGGAPAPGGARPYGPNTTLVRRFLQRLAALPRRDWERAAASYAELQRMPAFRTADRALGTALDAHHRTHARDAVVGPLLQLVAGVAGPAPDRAAAADEAAALPAELEPLAESALAALLSLVARDLLGATSFATLYGAFEPLIPIGEVEAMG